jgi:hypothetical protein
MGGVNLEQMLAHPNIGEDFQRWEKVAAALEEKRMPPPKLPQPQEAQRTGAVQWIRARLDDYAKKHDGDPGRVTVRRLTSAEYAYSIQDLTGLDFNVAKDLIGDEAGGEGFTNFADVQFMQDANLERYLEVAKSVADRAVIGAGPLSFFVDPGKTGFELSAVARIQDIYHASGFRTVSGEGGRPFGLERYGKALYVAWLYRYRSELGEPAASLATLAGREEISPRFAAHIWTVLNTPTLAHPSSEVAARWRKLPAPAQGKLPSELAVRAACEDIQKYLTTWPSWLFARGDVAAGGAGDERPLEFSDASLMAKPTHPFTFIRGLRGGGRTQPPPAGGTAPIYLNAIVVNEEAAANPMIVWRNATVAFRPRRAAESAADPADRRFADSLPRVPLHTVVTEESARKLAFGRNLDGSPLNPADFASAGSVDFEVNLPQGISVFDIKLDAELGANRDQVFRVTIADRADGGTRGVPVWGLVGDPQSSGYRKWKNGVLEFARLLPPNSHGEPTPADKDPIPEPFDNTYNVPEHDEFIVKVKYLRDDRFVVENILDPATRARLNHAWNDLYASFEYHDAYLNLLAKHYNFDLKGRGIAHFDEKQLQTLPADMRRYTIPLRKHYEEVVAAQSTSRSGHVEDSLRFAERAWRRPLTPSEKTTLRSFYSRMRTQPEMDHQKAIRALLARILVSPAFIYRVEPATAVTSVRPLSNWEMASRLSYFLWSSIPDDELRRSAKAGELSTSTGLHRQVRRMLADPKARRMSTEFFGQWLGFYRFDEYRGVDTARFPEFTDEVKTAMYDEAVAFFEHIIRNDRPVSELLRADYTFLNKPLAKHYGVTADVKSDEDVERVDGANAFQRGGMLRLGAVLTATSAPLRTSPVKRGDWVLRRIIGTPTPPPPADAGSIPADEKLFGGLSLREKLEAHQRNPSCAGCHTRIDPLGFPLEKYDAVGRWREQYTDGKPVHDAAKTADGAELNGVDGLLRYLDSQQKQVLRTLSQKLVGYALGRTVLASDQSLIERLGTNGMNSKFSDMVAEIVASPQFRHRRNADPQTPPAVARTRRPEEAGTE